MIAKDDQSSGQNLTAAQDLVQNDHVFAVVNESPFAFSSYRCLQDQGVPMIGAGTDGTYYQEKGNDWHPLVFREQRPVGRSHLRHSRSDA